MDFSSHNYLVVGEILWDVFDGHKRLGGAPFNVAFHVHQLGRTIRFVSGVGADDDGREIIEVFRRFRLPLLDIRIDPGHPTGKVLVQLNEQGDADYDILRNTAFDYFDVPASEGSASKPPDLIYFGSLIQRTRSGHDTLHQILRNRPAACKCLYDVNFRTDCYNESIVRESLTHSDVVKLNQNELVELKRLLGFSGNDESFIDYLLTHYHLEYLCVTLGSGGSHLYSAVGSYFGAAVNISELADTVGAGDAFTAVLAVGYLEKWPPRKILETASIFASRICAIEGALPLDNTGEFYNEMKAIISF